jgi:hypothetical protein
LGGKHHRRYDYKTLSQQSLSLSVEWTEEEEEEHTHIPSSLLLFLGFEHVYHKMCCDGKQLCINK